MSGKPVLYWDSCMFFEVLCNEDVSAEKRAEVNKILDENRDGKNVIVSSAIVHLECVPNKLEDKKPGALEKFTSMFDGEHFVDVEISANILTLARDIRDHYYIPYDPIKPRTGKMMDMGDAIHLATAIIFDASEFHTRDDNVKGSKVPLLSLYSYSGENKVCGKYHLCIVSPESDQGELDGTW